MAVEETHLSEQVAGLHQRHHRLAAVERLVGDGDPPGHDDVELVGLVVFPEDDIAAAQFAVRRNVDDCGKGAVVEACEQRSFAKECGVRHVGSPC